MNKVHFIGIGGTGISAIALLLLEKAGRSVGRISLLHATSMQSQPKVPTHSWGTARNWHWQRT